MTRSPTAGTQVRLQRFLAQAGVAARRKAEELIVAGRVTVDGKVVTTLGTKIDPDHANVQVDGEGVSAKEHFYIVFNKPKGCITAVTDDRGRLTVMDYLPNLPINVAPVGRLDFYSEGVLLLTNDGDLAARLLGPHHHIAKTYHVKIRGSLGPRDLDRLRTGVTLDDGTVTQAAEVDVLRGQSRHDWLVITLYEGKSRQIHRMMEALGHQVQKLQRVAFAHLTFHGLRIGDARELTQQELNELRELVGLDRREVARGSWTAEREDTDRARRQHAERQAEAALLAAPGGDAARYSGGLAPTAPTGPADDDDDDDDPGVFERQLDAAQGRPASPSAPGRADRGRPEPGRPSASAGGRPARGRPSASAGGRPERARPSASGPGRPDRGRPSASAGGRPERGRPSSSAPGRPERGRPSSSAPGRPERGRPSSSAPGRPVRGRPSSSAPGRPERGRPERGRPSSSAPGRPERGRPSAGAPGRPERDRPERGRPERGRPSSSASGGRTAAESKDRREPRGGRDERRGPPPTRDARRGGPKRSSAGGGTGKPARIGARTRVRSGGKPR